MTKRVLIEASSAVDAGKSGVGYYVLGLLSHIKKNNKYTFFAYYFNFLSRNTKSLNNISSGLKLIVIKYVPGKIISIFKYINRRAPIELFIKRRFDFILFTNYVALPSLRKTPYGVIVYDLSFLDCPEYLREKNLKYLTLFSPPSIAEASLVVTISEFTKARLRHHFPNLKAKIVVTHIPPVTQKKTTKVVESTATGALSSIKGKYILYVGTVEPRKNITKLVKAYSMLPKAIKESYSLVIAGGKGWKNEEIYKTMDHFIEQGEKIVHTGYVSETDKERLYKNTSLFVLPSHYEGFGMPILEAMQYDIPLAISDLEVFHEVAGDLAVYFDQNNEKDIAKKILIALEKNKSQAELRSKYKKHLAQYSWSNNIGIVFGAIDNILEEKSDNE
jgi:glycosyltransferase involved in cell wall biosynthesis